MKAEEIKRLLELLEGTDVTEFELEEEGKKIRIKKGYQGNELSLPSLHKGKENKVEVEEKDEEDKGSNREEIVAPMVGTFYRAPAPEADPFVEKGDTVTSGDTLCIIEAMKLMNEIEAETRGRIIDILVENGEPIEYGQPLFIIELL